MSGKNDNRLDISLALLQENDREQFIKDNQWAFRYGAQIEFGMRDDRTEEGSEVISRGTIERCIDGENAEAYRIVQDGKYVGGVVLSIDKKAGKGELELLFVSPDVHSHGIGQAAWKAVEKLHPEIRVWETQHSFLRQPLWFPDRGVLEQAFPWSCCARGGIRQLERR